MRAEEIEQAMVTEYSVGTPIGWHRDSPQFETIIGISIASACRMRLKPYNEEGKVVSVMLEPRSDDGVADWNLIDLDGVTEYPIFRVR